jgi:hypothetical protein
MARRRPPTADPRSDPRVSPRLVTLAASPAPHCRLSIPKSVSTPGNGRHRSPAAAVESELWRSHFVSEV